jgi:hypothetical protein
MGDSPNVGVVKPARSMTFLKQLKAHAGIKTRRGQYHGGTKQVPFLKSSLLGGWKLQLHTVVCRIHLKYHALHV